MAICPLSSKPACMPTASSLSPQKPTEPKKPNPQKSTQRCVSLSLDPQIGSCFSLQAALSLSPRCGFFQIDTLSHCLSLFVLKGLVGFLLLGFVCVGSRLHCCGLVLGEEILEDEQVMEDLVDALLWKTESRREMIDQERWSKINENVFLLLVLLC